MLPRTSIDMLDIHAFFLIGVLHTSVTTVIYMDLHVHVPYCPENKPPSENKHPPLLGYQVLA